MYMTNMVLANRYNDMFFTWQHMAVTAGRTGITYGDLDLVKEDRQPDELFYPPFDDHIPFEVYDRVVAEPTEASWRDAIAWARKHDCSHFLA